MRPELIIKTRSLAGSSDLTLLAPIKPGLVPSLESVTYKTRAKRLLATLNAGRTSSHEYSFFRPFSDAVERVGKIQSVRVAIVEPDRLLLSVTFDGGFESYLRVLWQKVGTLLDVIFCNTEGYPPACTSAFDEWSEWVRKVQIETDFFYGMPAFTVDDAQYLRKQELLRRQMPCDPATDLLATQQAVQSAEELAWSQLHPPKPLVVKEVGRQGLRALALVYRLTNYYLPGTPDGEILHRATRELLQEFILLAKSHALDPAIKEGRKRFDEQITWLLREAPQRKVPELPKTKPQPDDPRDVQAGIIGPYPDAVTHGCLLLVAFRDRLAAARFLEALAAHVSREGTTAETLINIAFTCEGLRAVGLADRHIDLFPPEFREGMEARASVLGDLRTNHPRRWRLPARNWNLPAGADAGVIELSSMHALVQLRTTLGPASMGETLDEADPLFRWVQAMQAEHPGVEVLSVQPMVRHLNENREPREHFGFVDGKSQPVLDPNENGKIYDRNQVHLGELLLGYDNEADWTADPDTAPDPQLAREGHELLHNGSFLVVRKLAQDVEALEAAVKPEVTGLDKELVLAKMMGRRRNGEALAAGPGKGNDFDYTDEDPPGSVCPFHAHIRRANPRQLDNPSLPTLPGRRTPRLMRRGMSYGPLYDPADPNSSRKPRGVLFMAYSASIAEQFEVVQRWISGGNSSGGFSGQGDPFMGVAPNGERKWFSFEHDKKVYRIRLDGSDAPLGEARPFVRLDWGAYLFAPSVTALALLARTARERADLPPAPVWSVEDGWRRIEELRRLEKEQGAEQARSAWKALLEDPEAQKNFQSAGVWAAIRRYCDGVLRTPYGVIVADRHLVDDVLASPGGLFSVSGYHERMVRSLGEIFLGLDDRGAGCPYREQSTQVNDAIGRLDARGTFLLARDAAAAKIGDLVANEKALSEEFGERHWELNLDVKEVIDRALEALCQAWFGLPAKRCEIEPGGARWDWRPGQPVRYPGHFTAPSRYFFQPWPGDSVAEYGIRYGEALRQQFGALIKRHRDDPAAEPVLDATAPLTQAIFRTFPRRGAADVERDDLAARTMVGALMGFLPTLDGNLRLSLNEWLRDGSFWSLRASLSERNPADPYRNALDVLERRLRKTMQLRPSPELIWRTATRSGKIGAVPIERGERIIIAIVSATQQCLESERPGEEADLFPIFGGDRRTKPHPTHACPGYDSAMGALLGVAAALLEVGEHMRASVAPLALTLEGDLPPTHPLSLDAEVTTIAGVQPLDDGIVKPAAITRGVGTGHLLVADGDSWLSYSPYGPFSKQQNIAEYLKTQHGFALENLAEPSTWLYDFYDDDRERLPLRCDKPKASSRRLDNLLRKVKRLVAQGRVPAAILFSAAGNDVVEGRLTPLLNVRAAGRPELIEELVAATVDRLLRCLLEAILDRIVAECISAPGVSIPVFIHGYDFPVCDARYVAGTVSERNAWLYPSFKAKEYESATYPSYPALGTPIMAMLIRRLNTMQADVVHLPRFRSRVFHVDLTGMLSNRQADYERDWDNELHPTKEGFTRLTQRFADKLVQHIPALQAQG